MTDNKASELNNRQNNIALGKKPNLSQKQLKTLRMVLQQVSFQQKNTYFYNIAIKQSNWGFSQNQRLIILNIQQKSFGYISKIPQGYLPFQTLQQLTANKLKQKILLSEVQNFKCHPIKGKISSLTMEWEDKQKKKHIWTFVLGSSKLMNDWVGLINSVVSDMFDKGKYEEMNKINKGSVLLSPGTNVEILGANNNNNFNGQKVNENEVNNQNINLNGNNNMSIQNLGYQKDKNSLKSDSNNNLINNINDANKTKKNSNPNFLSNQPSQGNSNFQPPFFSTQNRTNSKQQINANNDPYDNSSFPMQNQERKKMYIPKLGSNANINNNQINGRNNQNGLKINNDYRQQQYNLNRKQSNSKYLDANTIGSFSNLNQAKIMANNQPIYNNYNVNKQQDTIKSPNNQTRIIDINTQSNQIYKNNYNSQLQQQNFRKNSQPHDFVQELKNMKQKNPNKFDLTNQLSQKKLVQYNNNNNNSHEHLHSHEYQQQKFNTTDPQMTTNIPQGLNSTSSAGNKLLNYQNNQIEQQNIRKQSYKQKQDYIQPILINQDQHNLSRNFTKKSQFSNSNINIQMSRSTQKNPVKMNNLRISTHNNNQYLGQQYDNQGQQQQRRTISQKNNINLIQQDNYDEQQVRMYKPTLNFQQSTKNLSKIRSDYLQRNNQNFNTNHTPQTSNNRKSKFNDSSKLNQNFNSRQNLNQKSSLKNDSINEKRRFQSINNLKNLNNKYSQKSLTQSQKYTWNQIWLQTSNPNKKIQIHQQFINHSQSIIKQIIQQLPLPLSMRKYQPLDIKENIYTYRINNILFSLHLFQNNESINDSTDNINLDSPVIYDQTTYDQLKREFYNYNLILNVTNNQGVFKVPLCSYFQYRGILVLCKAEIPSNYREVQAYEYKKQFEALFLFGSYNTFEYSPYRGGQGKFIVLWNLNNLIPGIPNSLKNQTSYFRKQLLLQYDQILQDLQSSSQAHSFTLTHIIPQLLSKLQSLQLQIIHSHDLLNQMHKSGLSLSYLPNLYQQTSSLYLKKIFMSQIVSCIFNQILRSELNHAYIILPSQNMYNIGEEQINEIILDCAHVLINQFFSYSLKAENIWKIVVKQASKKYRIIVSKEDVIPGYLLSAIFYKSNINGNFKHKSFRKSEAFFVTQHSIPRQTLQSFKVYIRRYDMQFVCPTYSKCKQIIQKDQQTPEIFDKLNSILNLNTRKGFHNYFKSIIEELKTYLCYYIPYNEEEGNQYEYLDVFQYIYQQPLTSNSVKSSFLAVKWLIKNNKIQRANQLFELKFHELSFWLGQYNPSITEFYDFFSMYYASVGNYQQSICLAKSSLVNVHKILGIQALPVADKHYQLGNIYFKIGKKNDALKQYNKTKQVLRFHQKTTIPEYGIILLKISLLCLNFGQLTDCIENAIQAERIFQNNGGSQNQQIQCFQVLARVYEVTKKSQDSQNLIEACAKTFNLTQNPKILQRMLKIILYSKLSTLSSQQQRSLSQILIKLQQQTRNSYQQAFNFLNKKAQKGNLKKRIYLFLQNIVQLTDEVNRRDLIRKHNSLSSYSGGESQEMLDIFQAVGIMIGFNFMIGVMKDTYYQ